jgi:hypothetical protein
VSCPNQSEKREIPAPLIIGAGTKKNRGLSAKTAPEQVRVSFCGHPAPLFCGCVCQNPGGAGKFTVFALYFGQNCERGLLSTKEIPQICIGQNN